MAVDTAVRVRGTGRVPEMPERDDEEREYDLRWAEGAEHKEPSARARMLAARWKENPPGPVPFRADPDHVGSGRRSSWVSTAVVLGCVAAVIVLLGYLEFRAPY
jgi:ferric-dicitrate binding protein FerR (iron transport regulator)